MSGLLNQALIYYWMVLNPAKLFQRINGLDWYKNTLRAWVDDLNTPTSAKVLEVASATGVLTEYMAACGFVATGIDASNKMINAALANKHHRADYQTADAKSLPFNHASFDLVTSASLLNIVPEPEKVVSEMTRVCKLDGVVSVLVPKKGFTDDQLAELINSKCVTGFSAAVLSTWNLRAPKMHPQDIVGMFNQSGLKTTQARDYLGGMVTSVSGVKR